MFRLAVVLAALALTGCRFDDWSWEDGPESEALAEYKASYYRELGSQFTGTLDWDQLLTHLEDVRVLYLGDHHRDLEAHDRALELLRRLSLAGLQPALGLECVGEQDRVLVELYLDGAIEMNELRQRMHARWSGSWLDAPEVDRSFYRELVRMARENLWPVFPLEPTPRLPLLRRDDIIAGNVRAAARAHPERLLVIIVGQAHLLGRGNLVRRVDLPQLTIGASLSPQLLAATRRPAAGDFLQTDAGVVFFQGSALEEP